MPSNERNVNPLAWNKKNKDRDFLLNLGATNQILPTTTAGSLREKHTFFQKYPYDNFNSNLNTLKRKLFKNKKERGKW
jgi:hypothetical protein